MASWNGVFVDYWTNFALHSAVVAGWVVLVGANVWFQPTAEKTSAKPPFLTHFTGMRFVASMMVDVQKHFFSLGMGPDPTLYDPYQRMLFTFQICLGGSGVCFFVTLSGFVTHYVYRASLDVDPVSIFYIKRVGRVVPTILLSQALSIGYQYYFDRSLPTTVNFICMILQANVLFYPFNRHKVQDPGGANGVCWTVQALLWIWLVYPFVARTLKRWSVGWDPKAFCVALIVAGVTLIWGTMMSISIIWGPHLLNYFPVSGAGSRTSRQGLHDLPQLPPLRLRSLPRWSRRGGGGAHGQARRPLDVDSDVRHHISSVDGVACATGPLP